MEDWQLHDQNVNDGQSVHWTDCLTSACVICILSGNIIYLAYWSDAAVPFLESDVILVLYDVWTNKKLQCTVSYSSISKTVPKLNREV